MSKEEGTVVSEPVVDTVDNSAEIKKAIEAEFTSLIHDLKIGQYGAVAIEVYTNKILQILQSK